MSLDDNMAQYFPKISVDKYDWVAISTMASRCQNHQLNEQEERLPEFQTL